MQFHNISLIVFSFLLVFLSQVVVSTAVSESEMDSQHPAFTQNISPEHIPGSNMIGAGRGRRVQNWKATQATNAAQQQQQHEPQPAQPQPQQHSADRK